MKLLKITSLVIVLVNPLVTIAQETEQKQEFSLQTCIDYALKNNVDVINSSLERDIAKAQVGETTAEGLPQININVDLTNNFNLRKAIIDASNFDPSVPEGTEVEFAFGLQYDGNAGIQLSQLIFDGSYFVGLRAARTFKELSEKNHIKSKIDVVDAISKAYYMAVVSEDRYALLKSNLGRYDTLLTETTLLFENGFAEKIDVNRVKVLNNNTKSALKSAEEVLRLSYDLLKFQMGYPVKEPIIITDKIEDITIDFKEAEISEFDYSDRIEYSQLLTNRSLAELQKKNNQVQYLPKVDLFANLGYNTNTNMSSQLFEFGDRWLSNGNIGLSMQIPVFDGLRKKYRIQQNKIQIAQIDNQIGFLKNNIDLEITQSQKALAVNVENLSSQKENMELAGEVYDVTKIKYAEGVGSNTDVVNAATTYRESQTNYYNALYEALIAKVELDRVLGKLLN